MSGTFTDALDLDNVPLSIVKELKSSESSSIFVVELQGKLYVMKLFHDNGDPGFTEKGRDLNRFRCELNAYRNLHSFGVCERGFVPYYYGYIDRLDPTKFCPHLTHFANDLYNPRGILLEYLQEPEELNCVNYSDSRFQIAIDGLREIHGALIQHRDVYPKNILIARERVVWIDFDVAVTFPDKESMNLQAEEYCQYEMKLFKSFGELLVRIPYPGLQHGLTERTARGSKTGSSSKYKVLLAACCYALVLAKVSILRSL
ncbi:hypothetical protein KXX25_006465 [Aspergillus fumigatus]|nr:hypothetical protein CNMCM8057_007950 [Aspergillus fumigatus]KAH1401722.1 hypothetical protein KXX51_003294 [Aspergillus fumigatus]KAH1564563.1 hypothetical protein KXX28_003876 [Aspergillus fumigatus]KAH1588930.1 hypothetical protein KXX44_009564 [Aspergillus fumigatus]KAH1620724.1 hypothetical protein KXX39_007129 [Aspergillus fumigatus]